MIRHLSVEEIIALHTLVIEDVGGSDGVRDWHLLASIAERPKASFSGTQLYKTVFSQAAALCEAIVNYHVFVDGNKRTAFLAMSRYLAKNSYELRASDEEAVDTMVQIAEKRMNLEELTGWIKKNSKKI